MTIQSLKFNLFHVANSSLQSQLNFNCRHRNISLNSQRNFTFFWLFSLFRWRNFIIRLKQHSSDPDGVHSRCCIEGKIWKWPKPSDKVRIGKIDQGSASIKVLVWSNNNFIPNKCRVSLKKWKHFTSIGLRDNSNDSRSVQRDSTDYLNSFDSGWIIKILSIHEKKSWKFPRSSYA